MTLSNQWLSLAWDGRVPGDHMDYSEADLTFVSKVGEREGHCTGIQEVLGCFRLVLGDLGCLFLLG